MKTENLFDIRFVVPPLLMALFIFLFSPGYFLKLVPISLTSLVLGSAIVLAIGFLISSITDAFITIFKARTPKGLSELEVWLALDKKGKHVTDQIHKKWHMAIANFNSLAAVILAPIVLSILQITGQIYPTTPTRGWLFFYYFCLVASALIFWFNGYNTHKKLMEIDRSIT